MKVTNQRDLGVSVSCNLSWSTHYGKICQKAYGALNLIKRSLPANASISLIRSTYILHLSDLSCLIARNFGHYLPGESTKKIHQIYLK